MRYDELGQTSVPVTPTRPLAVDGDSVLGALAARRELGPESDSAVVAAFLDQTGMAIDARVAVVRRRVEIFMGFLGVRRTGS